MKKINKLINISILFAFSQITSLYAADTILGGAYFTDNDGNSYWKDGGYVNYYEDAEGNYISTSDVTDTTKYYYSDTELTYVALGAEEEEDANTQYYYKTDSDVYVYDETVSVFDETVTGATTSQTTAAKRDSVSVGSTATYTVVRNYLQISSALYLYGTSESGAIFNLNGGNLGVQYITNTPKGNMYMYENSTLNLKAGNAYFVDVNLIGANATINNSGTSTHFTTLSMADSTVLNITGGEFEVTGNTTISGNAIMSILVELENSKLQAVATISMGDIVFSNDTDSLTLYLDISEITSLGDVNSLNIAIDIEDFISLGEDSIFSLDDLELKIETGTDSEFNEYGIAASYDSTNNSILIYNTSYAVPEPSTYAMIFAFVAFAFTYYKKRK